MRALDLLEVEFQLVVRCFSSLLSSLRLKASCYQSTLNEVHPSIQSSLKIVQKNKPADL